MNPEQLKQGRRKAGLTQVQAARRLQVSQPYLSQLEKGQRLVTAELARLATSVYRLPATSLPVPAEPRSSVAADPDRLSRQLGSLGYPGFAHLRARAKVNPAAVVLEALLQEDLDVRVSEALPWILLHYPDMNWQWLVRHLKLNDVQNRLGFLVATARELPFASQLDFRVANERLHSVQRELEHARLAREDTLCRASMPAAERSWLKKNRSSLARHWNLLTSLSADELSYA